MIAMRGTQPWSLNRLVATRELPIVQPPVSAAPMPIAMPSTSITDQSTRVTSPVVRKVAILAGPGPGP